MKLVKKIFAAFGNIRLRERMLLLYFLGGILPLLFANIYMYTSLRSVMIQQAKDNAIEELSVIGNSLEESISVIETVSKMLYFDEDIEHIAFTRYDNYEDIVSDYREHDNINDYVRSYYQDISSITIYTYNMTLSNNEHFVYADATAKSSDWYPKTRNLAGSPYWSYQYDNLTHKNNLCLSRMLYTTDLEPVGVAFISMQNLRSELLVSGREEDTFLFYDDVMVVHSNNSEADYDELFSILMKHEEDSFADRVTYQGEDCLISYLRIRPDYADDFYTIVSVTPYREIVAVATRTALNNLLPMFLCVILALLFIILFSYSFSARVNTFKNEMHKAATGDFSIAASLQGKDEIAELYQDLNAMIKSIRELMEKVVQEQVQKEQINTRQKEVEFKMLASQINPHFLYNTLETIRMQARVKNQPEIEELAKMLAKIMRHNIQVGDTLQPLTEELKLIRYYLKIQDYRFHDRITYEIRADEAAIAQLRIMPLLIQPFVENAFVHGLESKQSGGRILICVDVQKQLLITVSDNGCGMDEEKLAQVRHQLNDFDNLDRTHIGICNVNQRIRLQYGAEYGVTIESKEQVGTTVTIRLPVLLY
jgi:two-component system sensor histidine kinase YesM